MAKKFFGRNLSTLGKHLSTFDPVLRPKSGVLAGSMLTYPVSRQADVNICQPYATCPAHERNPGKAASAAIPVPDNHYDNFLMNHLADMPPKDRVFVEEYAKFFRSRAQAKVDPSTPLYSSLDELRKLSASAPFLTRAEFAFLDNVQ